MPADENLLLAALPREERERLDPFLGRREAALEDTLIEPDQPITGVFFPADAITSTVQEFPDGATVHELAAFAAARGQPGGVEQPHLPARIETQMDRIFDRPCRDVVGTP